MKDEGAMVDGTSDIVRVHSAQMYIFYVYIYTEWWRESMRVQRDTELDGERGALRAF